MTIGMLYLAIVVVGLVCAPRKWLDAHLKHLGIQP